MALRARRNRKANARAPRFSVKAPRRTSSSRHQHADGRDDDVAAALLLDVRDERGDLGRVGGDLWGAGWCTREGRAARWEVSATRPDAEPGQNAAIRNRCVQTHLQRVADGGAAGAVQLRDGGLAHAAAERERVMRAYCMGSEVGYVSDGAPTQSQGLTLTQHRPTAGAGNARDLREFACGAACSAVVGKTHANLARKPTMESTFSAATLKVNIRRLRASSTAAVGGEDESGAELSDVSGATNLANISAVGDATSMSIL